MTIYKTYLREINDGEDAMVVIPEEILTMMGIDEDQIIITIEN